MTEDQELAQLEAEIAALEEQAKESLEEVAPEPIPTPVESAEKPKRAKKPKKEVEDVVAPTPAKVVEAPKTERRKYSTELRSSRLSS